MHWMMWIMKSVWTLLKKCKFFYFYKLTKKFEKMYNFNPVLLLEYIVSNID